MTIRKTDEFKVWLASLSDEVTKGRITKRVERIASDGHLGVTRSVGGPIREMKLDFGPGYRVYYTQRGTQLILLLLGGEKRSQERDIAKAHEILRRLIDCGEIDELDY